MEKRKGKKESGKEKNKRESGKQKRKREGGKERVEKRKEKERVENRKGKEREEKREWKRKWIISPISEIFSPLKTWSHRSIFSINFITFQFIPRLFFFLQKIQIIFIHPP